MALGAAGARPHDYLHDAMAKALAALSRQSLVLAQRTDSAAAGGSFDALGSSDASVALAVEVVLKELEKTCAASLVSLVWHEQSTCQASSRSRSARLGQRR